jgi:hypothetical protein
VLVPAASEGSLVTPVAPSHAYFGGVVPRWGTPNSVELYVDSSFVFGFAVADGSHDVALQVVELQDGGTAGHLDRGEQTVDARNAARPFFGAFADPRQCFAGARVVSDGGRFCFGFFVFGAYFHCAARWVIGIAEKLFVLFLGRDLVINVVGTHDFVFAGVGRRQLGRGAESFVFDAAIDQPVGGVVEVSLELAAFSRTGFAA